MEHSPRQTSHHNIHELPFIDTEQLEGQAAPETDAAEQIRSNIGRRQRTEANRRSKLTPKKNEALLELEGGSKDLSDVPREPSVGVVYVTSPNEVKIKTPTPEMVKQNIDRRRRLGAKALKESEVIVVAAEGDDAHIAADSVTLAPNGQTMSVAEQEDREEAAQEKWYKVTDKRKWSRTEYLGREVGPHSNMHFTAPIKWPTKAPESDESEQKISSESSHGNINVKDAQEVKHSPATKNNDVTPSLSEKYAQEMNNDPAIEQAVAKLDTLRDQVAGLMVDRLSRPFHIDGRKREALMAEYNQQILTLGRFINSDAITDSQKNVFAAKFLLEEQARLREATNQKTNKVVTWENSYRKTLSPLPDTIEVVKAIEPHKPEDDKFRHAQKYLENVLAKENRV